MKFSIQSADVNNSWYKNPDLKIVELYPILKDKITTINIADDSEKGYYSVNVMQLIVKIDCDIIVGKPILNDYAKYDIKGELTIYDDYME